VAETQIKKNESRSWPVRETDSGVLRLLVTANVPSSPILVTLMMEAIYSSETSVLKRTTRSNIPKDGILHSHRRVVLNGVIVEKWLIADYQILIEILQN
jgi:hypothetical protein